MESLGLYLHVPFCAKKCKYCDFLSFAGCGDEAKSAYIEALEREIREYGSVYNKKYFVDTVFVGGGTPSVLPAKQISRLLAAVRESFSLDPGVEISMEANPATVDEEKLAIYREAGINRLSFGVQSFDDAMLKLLGRIHTAEEAVESCKLARKAGFTNVNLDLMLGLPKQSLEVWKETLRKARDLAPEHISFYSLQIEPETPLCRMIEAGELPRPSDEADREMYHFAVDFLKGEGYHHYEISNAALPGFESRHNLKYWNMEPYLGLGLGAASYIEGRRFSNVRDLQTYEKKLASGKLPVAESYENTPLDDREEYLFLGLRKCDGISLSDFEKRFSEKLEEHPEVQRYLSEGLFEREGDALRFSLEGIDISNTVLADII